MNAQPRYYRRGATIKNGDGSVTVPAPHSGWFLVPPTDGIAVLYLPWVFWRGLWEYRIVRLLWMCVGQ